jgi:predicted ATPase
MKLKLKNIGTLKQAEIDLSKDLIILAGPNNTGKTYAAYTVYGVCEILRKEIKPYFIDAEFYSNNSNLFKEKGLFEIETGTILDIFLNLVSKFIKKNTSQQLKNIFATNDTMFSNSTLEVIDDKEALVKYLFQLEINIIQKPLKSFISNELKETRIIKKSEDELIKIYINLGNNSFPNMLEIIDSLNDSIDFLFEKIIDFFFKNIYINTAERSAISIFSKELSIKRNNIVDQLLELRDSKNGDANQLLGKLQRYPLPIRDSLAISEDLANLSRNKSEFGFLADRIEEVLLDGKITTSKDGEVQYSPNNSKVKNLSIHLTASIVKSLSNLVFYFRHIAQKGDFIIIDEPELNLHPDNQRKVARLFGEIINQGFKVMISTHSDYIIRELNNLIMLKSGGEKAEYLAGKYGYEEKQLIDYQRVGAYLFNHNKNISLEVTEVGFEVGTIDEEINNLNNASEEIYFTLFD